MKKLSLIFIFIFCFFNNSIGICAHFDSSWGVPLANLGPNGFTTTGLFLEYREGTGTYHFGADLAATDYDFVGGIEIACAEAYIYEIGFDPGGYGNYIILQCAHQDYPDGVFVLYGHWYTLCEGIREGITVPKGTPLTILEGENGEWTGRGSGPHLHLEIQPNLGQSPFDAGTSPVYSVDPAQFIPEIQLGYGDAPNVNAPHGITPGTNESFGKDSSQFVRYFFEFKFEMLDGFRKVFEGLAQNIVEAMSRIKGIVRSIFIILIMIDLALGTMFVTFAHGNTSLTRYITFKFLFYGIMLLLIDNFGVLANNLVRDWFIAGAGKAMSTSEAEVIRIVSDPMFIIEKGLHIIQPIFNELLNFVWPIGKDMIATLSPWLADQLAPAPGIFTFLILLIGVVVYLMLLVFIGMLIALAYLQFYFLVLFGFTTIMFAGTKETSDTRLANRGVAGVFAGAINLMFYCMFSLLLSNSLVSIAEQAQASNVMVTKEVEGIQITDARQLRDRIRTMETGGKSDPYHDKTITGSDQVDEITVDTYGAFHIKPTDWESWTEEAYKDNAPLIPSEDGGEEPTPSCRFKWTPENQEALALWKMEKDYQKSKNWEKVAEEWYNNSGPHSMTFKDYWGRITGKPPDNKSIKTPTGSKNIMVVIQLNLCLLLFAFMGVRISNLISQLFQDGGFEFLISQDNDR